MRMQAFSLDSAPTEVELRSRLVRLASRIKKDPFGVFLIRVVHLTRLELAQPCGHYHLKVACIPISPQVHTFIIPQTGWIVKDYQSYEILQNEKRRQGL